MRYVMAKYVEYQKDMAYRVYVTDSIFYYGDNKRLSKRFFDIVHPEAIDPRSGDEIALDVINSLGLKVE